jgi:superfamily II DNA or RNA helicase
VPPFESLLAASRERPALPREMRYDPGPDRACMEAFLENVRKASLPGMWSQGVKLARDKAVVELSSSSKEVTVRVRTAGRGVSPTVTLYLDEEEWTCDCGSNVDPCAHVAAAANATAQGLLVSATAATTERAEGPVPFVPPMRLVYELRTEGRQLMLSRFIVRRDGKRARVTRSLIADLGKNALPSGLDPTHGDLEVDRLLGVPPREAVGPALVAAVFQALAGDAEVRLNGAPVRISGDRVVPRATLEDAPDGGFELRMQQDPAVTEVVALGVVRCNDVLRPIAEGETTGYALERLPLARTFSSSEEADLVTRVLPELDKRVALTVKTARLRATTRDVQPRITMDLSHHGYTLSVLPLLVYGDPPIARMDGDNVVLLGGEVPIRKADEEKALLRRLRDELNLVPGRRVDLNGSDAIRFAAKVRDWQKRSGGPRHKELFQHRALVARLDLTDGRFDVEFVVEGDDATSDLLRRADAATVMRAYRDGLSLVPLEGGGWAPLPVDWLERYGDRVMDLLEARNADRKLPTAILPELGALCEQLDEPKPPGLERLEPLLRGFQGIPRARLPEGLVATLRPYQQVGVDWLRFLRNAELGAVLADDMGLGKTLQTICVLEGRALVVCPRSVVYNWAEEIARFRPGLRVATYHGPNRALDPRADVTLTTYSVLRLDVDLLAKEWWSVVVLDEAQAIKNATSQTARAAFELHGHFRIALSGTPVENRLEELWSVMHFANPGLLGGREGFQSRYSVPIANGNQEAAGRLRAKIRPFVLRRMKREVVPELPPRTDTVLHVELDENERNLYDAIRFATRKEVLERLAQGGGVFAALEALLRLRQAACHPELVPGQHGDSSSKVERLLEALEEVVADGHKALVFSQWTSLLDLVEPHFDRAGFRFTRLDGTTRDRGAVVSEFQDDARCPIMLASLKAGGTGLNLTAADHVFLLDPWWNPAVEDQAADRAHRIGQNRPVMVYRMVARDTVEERILALQEKKRALTDVALGNANHAGGITKEDLMALLD